VTPRRAASVTVAASAAVVAICAVFALTACPKPPVEAAMEHWCPEGFEVGHGDVCFALPPTHGPHTGIVVYLHGHMEGRGDAAEWAAAHGVVARGYAVVLPRGRRALCALKAGREDEFCWPHGGDPGEIRAVLGDWDHTLWQVNELLEGAAHPRFVLASGEGATFAARLAQSGAFKAKAFALVGAGDAPAEPGEPTPSPPAASERPSVLLLEGPEGEKINRLDKRLSGAGLPLVRCARSGATTLSTPDVETALRFFQGGGAFACDGAGRPAPAPAPAPVPTKTEKPRAKR